MAPSGSVKRVCLAYSGGLDTSVILRWLIEEYDCEVVAYCADVGQEEELSGLPEKARDSGAVDCIVRDVREEFVAVGPLALDGNEYIACIDGTAVYCNTVQRQRYLAFKVSAGGADNFIDRPQGLISHWRPSRIRRPEQLPGLKTE